LHAFSVWLSMMEGGHPDVVDGAQRAPEVPDIAAVAQGPHGECRHAFVTTLQQ
jgi:hypothetical protein